VHRIKSLSNPPVAGEAYRSIHEENFGERFVCVTPAILSPAGFFRAIEPRQPLPG